MLTESPPSPGDLLLDGLGVGLCEEVQHGAAEVVGVTVGIAQLVGDRVQEQVPACGRGTVRGSFSLPRTQKGIKRN